MSVWIGLAVHIPGDFPDLWIDTVEKPGFDHLLLEDGSVDR